MSIPTGKPPLDPRRYISTLYTPDNNPTLIPSKALRVFQERRKEEQDLQNVKPSLNASAPEWKPTSAPKDKPTLKPPGTPTPSLNASAPEWKPNPQSTEAPKAALNASATSLSSSSKKITLPPQLDPVIAHESKISEAPQLGPTKSVESPPHFFSLPPPGFEHAGTLEPELDKAFEGSQSPCPRPPYETTGVKVIHFKPIDSVTDPVRGPIVKPVVKQSINSSTDIAKVQLSVVERKITIFIEKHPYKSPTAELGKLVQFLAGLPKKTRANIPADLLEKVATITSNSVASFTAYDISEFAKLFHILDYKPTELVVTLSMAARKLIPESNPERLIRMLESFSNLYGYSKNDPLFLEISQNLNPSLNKCNAPQIMRLIHFYCDQKLNEPLLLNRLIKAITALASTDLRNRALDISGIIGDPLHFELTPQITLSLVQFAELLRPISSHNFSPEIVDSIDWNALDTQSQETRFLNIIANVVISQSHQLSTEEKNKFFLFFSRLGVNYAPLTEALEINR